MCSALSCPSRRHSAGTLWLRSRDGRGTVAPAQRSVAHASLAIGRFLPGHLPRSFVGKSLLRGPTSRGLWSLLLRRPPGNFLVDLKKKAGPKFRDNQHVFEIQKEQPFRKRRSRQKP